MSGALPALILLGWLAGIVLLAVIIPALIADEPMLRLVARMMPVAVALYLADVIVFWPAAVIARTLSALMKRERR
ncbi:hypothetical protein [Streptomyces sp. NPDC001828]|uniref:hypothetical protein n=1 Tax=Streptomyces sp. NPDC001828 TaxID=3364615 RepID=UPI0036D015CA